MYYAVNVGYIDANPATKIGVAFGNPIVKNMPALRPRELPELMQVLQSVNIGKQTKCLLEWQLLTITRSSEAAGARWAEIDLDNNYRRF